MSFQDMEIKTEIVEDQKTLDIFASYDENRPTQSDLNKDLLIVPDLNESEQSEDRNDVNGHFHWNISVQVKSKRYDF